MKDMVWITLRPRWCHAKCVSWKTSFV